MTTIESGTAVKVEYVPAETRAVAIHEAGHAVASHVYLKDVLSTRLSIRKRGSSLGHHQAIEKEERFSSWRSEEFAKLVWTLGAMAAEHVFYGENSTGVGGDVQSATTRAAWMVGTCGMGPEPIEPATAGPDERASRARGRDHGALRADRRADHEPRIRRQRDERRPDRRDPLRSRQAPGRRADPRPGLRRRAVPHRGQPRQGRGDRQTLVDRRELHGDEVVELLDRHDLHRPEIDLSDDTIWPRL